MTWEVEKHGRTLLIERLGGGLGGKDRFAISPFCLVTTKEGTTYVEPLPNIDLASTRDALRFDRVEFIDSPATSLKGDAGQLASTHRSSDYAARTAKA